MDPDGRFTRGSDGDLLFSPVREVYVSHHASGKQAFVQDGFLLTEDKIRVIASINRDVSEPGFDTNCHGVTFADGEYWINNDQVDLILEYDNYEKVDTPKVGDVVVYRSESGEAEHSATVVEIEKEISLFGGFFQWGDTSNVKVEGLGGVQTETRIENVEDAWINSQAKIEYYRKVENDL